MKLLIEIKQQGGGGVEITMASPPEKTITQQEIDAYKAIKASITKTVEALSGGNQIIMPGRN